ncbi:MAG: class I SAM-dependent methyltransferase, partial [Acidobacteria bacterium]|nr:class I SAM-dependent methyltransferase [Acidobacteriota bacterium]
MISIQKERRRIRREFNRIGWQYARGVEEQTERISEYVSWVPLPPGARILDVACGPGTYSLPLADRGGWVVGVDLSESMLQLARRRRPRLRSKPLFLQADAFRLPFVSEAFDLCLCAFSFAHFPQPRRAVKEMARVLRPQGRLGIFEVIAPDSSAEKRLLNRLEGTRGRCYTRIRDLPAFQKILSNPLLEWEKFHTERRTISFAQWAAASHLPSHSPVFCRAKKLFEAAVRQQLPQNCAPSLNRSRYSYRILRALMRKIS